MKMETTFLLICLTLPHYGLGEDFQLLVFGGLEWEKSVEFFPSLYKESCRLSPLPQDAPTEPGAGLMEGKITICGGELDYCYDSQSGDLEWTQSYELSGLSYYSHVTTYDYKTWSFLGYGDLYTWTERNDSFQHHELDFSLSSGSCSSRKNQTHAIVTGGSSNAHVISWYEDKSQHFQVWDEVPSGIHASFAGCETIFHPEVGYQFAISGGKGGGTSSKVTKLFTFEANSWTDGPSFPLQPNAITFADSVALQNEFLLVGGKNEFQDAIDTILMYNHEEGWITLPMTLSVPNYGHGAFRVPKGMLECP